MLVVVATSMPATSTRMVVPSASVVVPHTSVLPARMGESTVGVSERAAPMTTSATLEIESLMVSPQPTSSSQVSTVAG